MMLFVKTGRRILKPQPIQLFEKRFRWVDSPVNWGVTVDER